LIVCPSSRSPTTAESTDSGIVMMTINAERNLPSISKTIRLVSTAPSTPSITSPPIARVT
jgi:hypothetical protein